MLVGNSALAEVNELENIHIRIFKFFLDFSNVNLNFFLQCEN